MTKEQLLKLLVDPTSQRQFIMYEGSEKGRYGGGTVSADQIKHYFIEQMQELVEEEEVLLKNKGEVPAPGVLRQAKLDGFSDKYLSQILQVPEEDIREARIRGRYRGGLGRRACQREPKTAPTITPPTM